MKICLINNDGTFCRTLMEISIFFRKQKCWLTEQSLKIFRDMARNVILLDMEHPPSYRHCQKLLCYKIIIHWKYCSTKFVCTFLDTTKQVGDSWRRVGGRGPPPNILARQKSNNAIIDIVSSSLLCHGAPPALWRQK